MKGTLLIGTIVVALTGYLGYNFVYARHEAQRGQLTVQLREEQDNQRAQIELAAWLQELERYRGRLSPTTDSEWLIKEVVRLADAAEVQLTTITPETPQASDGFTRLGVSLDFTATYHQLGIFLDYVEHAQAFLQANRLDVTEVRDARDAPGHVAVRLLVGTVHVPALAPAS